MKSLQQNLKVYQQFLQTTETQAAYRELINYIKFLANHFKKEFPKYEVAHAYYPGYLDLTFFAFTTRNLKLHQLKVEVVFKHENLNFEIWLSGRNQFVMTKYYKLFQLLDLNNYHLVKDDTSLYSIIESSLVPTPNFDDLIKLTHDIETKVQLFVKDMENLVLETENKLHDI